MGVYEGRGQLAKGVKELLLRWSETRSGWDDVRSEDFEKRFLIPLEQNFRSLSGAMDHMAQLLAQIHRECE